MSQHQKSATDQDPPWILSGAIFATVIALGLSLSAPMMITTPMDVLYEEARQKAGGDPERGLQLMQRYGCAACHIVPGLKGARGLVGPTLSGFANRTVIGTNGVPNTPDNLARWIIYPAALDPRATMPGVGASETDARDMATFLYTLK